MAVEGNVTPAVAPGGAIVMVGVEVMVLKLACVPISKGMCTITFCMFAEINLRL